MRASIGVFLIFTFIGTFSLLFMVTTQELSSLKTLHQVLDEEIHIDEIVLSKNSRIVDRDKNTVSDLFSSENRIYLFKEDIPELVKKAFIATEDQSFYEHPGFDMSGIARAFLVNFRSQSVQQGGSTITQQLTRNIYLSHSQTYERKLTELLYSYQMERLLSKEKVIEIYVNSIYFANGVYGIEAASQYYFNLESKDLSAAQVAFLISIPNNPSHYNPLNSFDRTEKRKEWILKKMYEQSVVDENEYEQALAEEISLHSFVKQNQYPDFTSYVLHEFEQLVSKQKGIDQQIDSASSSEERSLIRDNLKNKIEQLLASGITIETALNPSIQRHVVDTLNHQLDSPFLQGATSVIDHDQAEIVSITGGTSYRNLDFHRGFQAFRQPGSAIKPLLVYAPLLQETNMNRASYIDASPFEKDNYQPQNFAGAIYGEVSIEEALKNSYNTAAVRMLDRIGINIGFSYLNQFDFTKISPTDYALPSALGGFTTGVSVNEMTRAYTAFATKGVYRTPNAIRQVVDSNGKVLYAWENESHQIWSEQTVFEMRKMLSKVISEGTAGGAQTNEQGYLGGKTGTTNDFHDLWFIGLNDHFTTGIWIGNDIPHSLSRESQENLHTRLWRDIMTGISRE